MPTIKEYTFKVNIVNQSSFSIPQRVTFLNLQRHINFSNYVTWNAYDTPEGPSNLIKIMGMLSYP